MSTPKRIQRKRARGYRMPKNAVYVGRPTKWGNPFRVARFDQYWAVESYGADGQFLWRIPWDTRADANRSAVRLYRKYLANDGSEPGQIRDEGGAFLSQLALDELKGKDLACFCPLDRPCHADVLLEIANELKG